MSVVLLKSDHVAGCPEHIISAKHYAPDGTCRCLPPEKPRGRSLSAKQVQAVALHECPACGVDPGWTCVRIGYRVTRLKFPHPERVQLIDPSLAGFEARLSRSQKYARGNYTHRVR